MEKIENKLKEVWREVSNQAVVTLGDIDKINRTFANTFMKIQRQRTRLEQSRDYWKTKYEELKKK